MNLRLKKHNAKVCKRQRWLMIEIVKGTEEKRYSLSEEIRLAVEMENLEHEAGVVFTVLRCSFYCIIEAVILNSLTRKQ
jgi:hypothetical protein